MYTFVLVVAMSMLIPTALAMAVDTCAVVGVGVLGTDLCRQILESSSTAQVTGITATTRNHDNIRQNIGHEERFQLLTADHEDLGTKKFNNVVFCAPPSGFEDYPAAVELAAKKYWSGPKEGVFVFTSSGAVYGPGEGDTVTEDSPVADNINSPRVTRLLNAERACLDCGGCVLRLAGLYNMERGAHNYWLTVGKPIPSSPLGIVNQLHYEDAASACLAALVAKSVGRVFLISDGHPQTRIEICQSALKAAVYKGRPLPQFSDESLVGGGKVYKGAASNAALQWKPRYSSFDSFMQSQA